VSTNAFMFIDRIAELGLLEHSSSSNIIGKFPLDVRCMLISQMSKYMVTITEINPSSLLTSETHVIFTMELVGQGFNLPLHQLSIIELSVSVYSGWLSDPSKRPFAIQNVPPESDVFQHFIQNIFKQGSLLFRPRQASEIHNPSNKKETNEELGELVRQHVDLCKKVISNYSKFLVDYSQLLSEESSIVILKVLLGICDAILKEPIQSKKKTLEFDIEHTGSYMGDKLCEILIQTLVDNYLKCKAVPVIMWDRLKNYFMTWTHRVQMINQWKLTTLDLSKQVIGDLSERSRSIMSCISEVSLPKEEQNVEAQRDNLYYAWHRMIYLIQNPILMEPNIFQTAIFGISKLVDEFLPFGLTLTEVYLF
jgi:hypothetical protein